MTTNTYVALDKVTVVTATPSITFSSIPSTYTDLILVCQVQQVTDGEDLAMQVNGDTGTNYSRTYLCGDGVNAHSGREGSVARIRLDHHATPPISGSFSTNIINIHNYSNTSTYKKVIARSNSLSTYAGSAAVAGMWRSTSAISSITMFCTNSSNIKAGSTFELYGILAEGVSPTTKATGGAVYSDSTYYYHVFGASGTFTPTQSITADLLVIAGGGGSGYDWSGSGGAGGVQFLSGQSLTATGYSVTVGAGGASGTGQGVQGSNGGASTFGSTIVSAVGGGGAHCFSSGNANSGGSGGGGGTKSGTSYGGSAVAGTGGIHYGNAGGNGTYPTGVGGGGGAGSAGESNTGTGGAGTTLFSSWGLATGAGTNVSGTYYFAAGGQGIGGAAYAARGAANTGNGAGSDNLNGAGGSGIVIVRYAK